MIRQIKSLTENEIVVADQYNQSAIAQTDRAIAIASGMFSQATTLASNTIAIASGNNAIATALNKETVVILWGGYGKVKGVKGSYIVAIDNTDAGLKVITHQVDGELIEENTWYTIQNGELVKAGE